MIPVGLPSLSFVLLVLFVLGVTLVWITWTVSLPFQPAGQRLQGHARKLIYALVTGIALFTIYSLVDLKLQLSAYQAEIQEKFKPTLATATRLAQLDMPAQTQLVLAVENQLDSFTKALLPNPVLIAGISARQVERSVAIQTDESHQTTSFQAESMRVIGEGHVEQQGWLCDATEPIVFSLHADGRIDAFEECILAAGNTIDGITLPSGTSARRSNGSRYTDGFVDQDRWIIDVRQEQIVEVAGLPLISPLIKLTQDRQLHEVSKAVLASDTVLDAVPYKAGAELQYNPRSQRDQHGSQWLVLPRR